MTSSSAPADAATVTAAIQTILGMLRDQYVFPDVADAIDHAIRARLDNDEYAGMTVAEVCAALTEQMQAISHDKHLRVFYKDQPQPIVPDPSPQEIVEQERLSGCFSNFGFPKAEVLPGNIGYLDIRHLFLVQVAGETAIAAMNFLAHTSALIIDLRQCIGGDAATVALLSSYLFDWPTHLNDIYLRVDNSTRQSWTLPYVPGRRYGDKPVYVLTSDVTFSGGEELAYNLQNLKRATIVGGTTRGGAHPGRRYPITEQITVCIPMGRAINPISGTNWEGSGVIPDIQQPPEQALHTAYQLALREVLSQIDENPTGPRKTLRDEIRQALDTP